MKALLPASASALLLVATATQCQLTQASTSTPTSYIDIHLSTSFTSTGSLETGYLFRVPASGSNFGGSPPIAPSWATETALTAGTTGGGKSASEISSKTTNRHSAHPSFRLMTPPKSDGFLCNESKGLSDYTNPAGNTASAVFDPVTLLSGFEGGYILVERGHCTFESKARSAQRLGATGVIIRNTLDSRYALIDENADTIDGRYNGGGPYWSNTKWPIEQRDYECGTFKASNHFGVRAEIETSKLDFTPTPYYGTNNNMPYYGTNNNMLLTGPAVDGNLCAVGVDSFEKSCPSERCLLTGRNATADGSKLEACCAWDLFMRMSTDGDDDGDAIPMEKEEEITIPALFVTMENGEELYDLVVDAENNSGGTHSGGSSVQFVNVVPYGRWYPTVHYSSIVVWALAIFTLALAAYESAKAYRNSWKKISKAVNEGTLVFQRSTTNANATGRERTETEETLDFGEDDVSEVAELEMTEQSAGPGVATGDIDLLNGTASPGVDSDFSIADDAEDMDDFVGNPGSPKPADATTLSNDGSFEPISVEDESLVPDTSVTPPPPPPAAPQQHPQRVNLQSRSTTAAMQNMEIKAFHAVIFIFAASIFLFILFFFNLNNVVRVIYGLGGSVAMTQIIFYPLYNQLSSKYLGDNLSNKLQSNAFGNLPGCRGEYFKWMDIAVYTTGYTLGIAWIIVGFIHVQPMDNAYYWLLQDVMGVCFCILILGIIQINSIMVATVLLSLVFVYDVFYVLISPYIFGTSVMVDVAMGVQNGVSLSFCEKYPSDSRCRGIFAPLPMLMAMPYFNDFRGGYSMLGLGDIVLPGLLISFAARYDAARALVRKCSQTSSIRSGENSADTAINAEGEADGSSGASSSRYHYHLGRVSKALFHGYFGPLMIAYAIGLMVAYIAVWTTETGQPALLYLVPACLGTTLFLGWRRRELSDLWSGPKVMTKANRMVCMADRIPATQAGTATEASGDLAETTTMV